MNFSPVNNKGASLIEILVTMLLLSTALLTLASLQTRALQFNHDSYFRSQANILGYDILDRIRANPSNMADYAVELSTFDGEVASTVGAERDIDEWLEAISSLPAGKGGIDYDATNRLFTITIAWSENMPGSTEENSTPEGEESNEDQAQSSFVYTARL